MSHKIIKGIVGDDNWISLLARAAGHLWRDVDTGAKLRLLSTADYLEEQTGFTAAELEAARLETPDDEDLLPPKDEDGKRVGAWMTWQELFYQDGDKNCDVFEDITAMTYEYGKYGLVIGNKWRTLCLFEARTLPLIVEEPELPPVIITVGDGEHWAAGDGEVIVFKDAASCCDAAAEFSCQDGRKEVPDEDKVVRRIPVSELLAAWIKLNPNAL